LNSIFADYSGDWFIPFVGDDVVVAKCISNLKKQSCIRYSERCKFRPKMSQNAFGGRAPPGPAGLERSPRSPSRNWGEGCLFLRGREGKGIGKGRNGWEGRKGRGGSEGEGRLASHTIFRPYVCHSVTT